MALFQQSVIKKQISDLNKDAVKAAWVKFQVHFHNSTIQNNIWDAKEEEYQEGFVRDLFVNILGYTLKPQPNYNFVLEKKTETDATKSDGALLRDDNIIGVVELKDTGTTELDKIEKQVFGYKHKHKNCVYAITSNFEKLRFYINDSTDFEEFNLFTLTEERFTVLYLCLQQQSIQNDVPLKMKQVSISEEENVTKKLYADYSGFKKELFNSIATLNPQYNKLELFKKTQKLLDRLLFILFAEDRGLLPPNSVREILSQWQQLKELDNYVSLYSRFVKYFGYLNTGHTGKQYDIFAYNGGLFAPDDILDNIKIDDNLLHNGGLTLSKYDFDSEVDVNILGHIFEHSLGEIEQVQAQLEGTAIDKTKTKRKKDGVFYTPRYITRYIVENTVGALCSQQKQTIGIQDDAFTPQKRKANTKQLKQQLDDYRQWLLHITICDPACGSGAFLNQALEFLIAEHRLIDELTAKLFGDAMVLSDVENTILENNIFGVDVNDEAVEIARLSLWLRTARKGRKLNNLSANIKCGNSLIDDPAVAGDKAFNWQKEFPQIFGEDISNKQKPATAAEPKQKHAVTEPTTYINQEEDEATGRNREQITNDDNTVVNTDFKIVNEPIAEYGNKKHVKYGFDVVIGNPPYVNAMDLKKNLSQQENSFLKKNYLTAKGSVDLYIYFFEKGLKIIKQTGFLSYITPNRFLSASYGKALREFLIKDFKFNALIDYSDKKVFPDASTYPVISIFSNKIESEYKIITGKFNEETKELNAVLFPSSKLGILEDSILGFLLNDKIIITEKIFSQSDPLEKCAKINATSTSKEADEYSVLINEDGGYKLINTGTIDSYVTLWGVRELTDKGKKYFTPYLPTNSNLLSQNRERLYSSPKIIISKIGLKCEGFYDKSGEYASINTNCLHSFDKEFIPDYILCWLNSKLYNYVFECLFDGLRMAGGYLLYSAPNLINTPIKTISKEHQLPFIAKADIMLAKNKELQQVKQQLQQLLLSKYSGLKLNNKLTDWPALTFADFLKELIKQKIKLSLPEEAEWLKYFTEQKTIANNIQQVITATDKEIDSMVYKLYDLTEEEIKVVEGC